jgi:hypothetical protein
MSDNLIPLISKSAGIAQIQMNKEIEGRLLLLNKSNAFNQVHKEVFYYVGYTLKEHNLYKGNNRVCTLFKQRECKIQYLIRWLIK